MSRYRIDIHGGVEHNNIPDGVDALVADGMSLDELLLDDLDHIPGAESGEVSISVTDTETGRRAYYRGDGKWKLAEAKPLTPGFVRLLSAAVHHNGDTTVTRIVGELSVEDLRTFIGNGFQLRLAPHKVEESDDA